MTEDIPTTPPLAADEKLTPIMVYTQVGLTKGDVLSKEAIRVSTWLRTPMAPEFLTLRHANVLILSGTGKPQSLSFHEYYIPAPQVIAYHLLPPHQDPLDFDESEPNRKMEPMTALVGSFRFNGHMRMAAQATLRKHLEVAHETYSSLYDVEITNQNIPALGTIRVPMVLLRPDLVTMAPRVETS